MKRDAVEIGLVVALVATTILFGLATSLQAMSVFA
jgi:hypothetical protein